MIPDALLELEKRSMIVIVIVIFRVMRVAELHLQGRGGIEM